MAKAEDESKPSPSAPVKPQLSPALSLFREAVLRDPQLQDQLRAADSCEAVAEIANRFFSAHIRAEVSSDLERTPLRGLTQDIFKDVFTITVEDLEQHILYQTNDQGEFLLGESELAMVAGSARVSAAGSNCYGCS
jgi:hypothetical protein